MILQLNAGRPETLIEHGTYLFVAASKQHLAGLDHDHDHSFYTWETQGPQV